MMKKGLLLSLLLLAGPAQAQLARSFSSAVYTGVGVSQMSSDFDNLGKAINLDAIAGYWLTPELPWGRLGAELNLAATVSPGKNAGAAQPSTITSGGGLLGGGSTTTTPANGRNTTDGDDLAAYALVFQAAYRTPGRLYGVGTLGYALTSTSIQEIEDKGRGGLAFSAGLGFRFGAETAAIEAVYSRWNSDLHTIGIRLSY